ncbi:MAG: DMT family transporter [Gammaproteobacteria bacterium]
MNLATFFKCVFVMLLWAICFPLITAGLDSSPHLSFATARAFLAGAALLALGIALRRPFPRGMRVWSLLAMTGLGATTLGFFGMFHAAEFISPGAATVIANTQPLMAAMLAHQFLHERLTLWGKLGLVIGFAGIVLIAFPELLSPTRSNSTIGVTYIVLAAAGITVSNVLIKRLAGRVDPLMAMGIQLLIGSVPLALIAGLTEAPGSIQWSWGFILVLLTLAFLGTSLVYWLWFSILETVDLSKANAFSFLIPIFGIALGAAFFGENFGWPGIIGAGLTILGLDLVVRRGLVAPAEIQA